MAEPMHESAPVFVERHGKGDAQAGRAARDPAELAELFAESGYSVDKRDFDDLFTRYRDAYDRRSARESLVDAAGEMSFPASDPPSSMGGAAVAGAPAPQDGPPAEKPSTRVSDPNEVKQVAPTHGTGKAPPERRPGRKRR